ncbi:MAG: (d)CMP kinase [Spirochaetaceae bacterium]|jgi:cytidylate kinase|nr:(d)CMP kinase [Spirochaetaceae bacterium]
MKLSPGINKIFLIFYVSPFLFFLKCIILCTMVVAIDGPAGSGKSTVAKRIAGELGILFLNSGSFYRGITLAALRAGIITDFQVGRKDALLSLAESLDMDYRQERLFIAGEDVEDDLHSDAVDAWVSPVSAVPEIRELVNRKIREVTGTQSVVCEGRDMTTVVFPDAEHQFYMDASIGVQAERRFKQGVSGLSLEEIQAAIQVRDENDKKKAVGALKIAPKAVYIDTSHLTISEVCAIIISKLC